MEVTHLMKAHYCTFLLCLVLVGCTPYLDVLVTPEHLGADSRYITFTNIGTTDDTLQDWHIDAEATRYAVPEIPLPAGESVNIWRGIGIADQHNVYLGDTDAYWHNDQELTVGKIHHTILGQKAEVYYFGIGSMPTSPQHETDSEYQTRNEDNP